MQPVAVRVVRREGERNIRDRTMRKSCHMHRANRFSARTSEVSRHQPFFETATRNALSEDREPVSTDGLADRSQTRLIGLCRLDSCYCILTTSQSDRCTRKKPELRAFVIWSKAELIIHAAHAAARHSRSTAIFVRPFSDHGFRGDQKAGDGRCVL